MYNFNNDQSKSDTWMKMLIIIRKVNEVVDDGGACKLLDSVFYSVDCNKSKDYVVTKNINTQIRDILI